MSGSSSSSVSATRPVPHLPSVRSADRSLHHIQQLINRYTATVNGIPASSVVLPATVTAPSSQQPRVALPTPVIPRALPKRMAKHCSRALRVPLQPRAAVPLAFSLTTPLATVIPPHEAAAAAPPLVIPSINLPVHHHHNHKATTPLQSHAHTDRTHYRSNYGDTAPLMPQPRVPLLRLPSHPLATVAASPSSSSSSTARGMMPSLVVDNTHAMEQALRGDEHFIESHSYASPALYCDARVKQLCNDHSHLSSGAKAASCAHLIDVMSHCLGDDDRHALMTLVDDLQPLIMASEYHGVRNATVMDPSLRRYDRERKHFRDGERWWNEKEKATITTRSSGSPKRSPSRSPERKRHDTSSENDTTDEKQQPNPPVTKSYSVKAGFQLVEIKEPLANVHHEAVPYVTVAAELTRENDDLRAQIDQLKARIAKHDEELASSQEALEFHQDWNSKKSLQMKLYNRNEASLAEDVVVLQRTIGDTLDDLDNTTQETLLITHEHLSDGLAFGGSYAKQVELGEEEFDHVGSLRATLTQLATQEKENHEYQSRLTSLHRDRDFLLTRIEILSQAVHMMHHHVDASDDHLRQRRRRHASTASVDMDNDDDPADAAAGYGDAGAAAAGTPIAMDDPMMIAATDGNGDDDNHVNDLAAENDEDDIGSSSLIPLPRQTRRSSVSSDMMEPSSATASQLRGRGTGADVPIFLHTTLPFVKFINLSMRDVQLRIKEIWSLKSLADQKSRQRGEVCGLLADYFHAYLRRRFKNRALERIEFAYNFIDSVERAWVDPDCMLFIKIVNGDIHEEHYYDTMMMVANFKQALYHWDDTATTSGCIDWQRFVAGLKTFFPIKVEWRMQELLDVVSRDAMTDDGRVDISRIVTEGAPRDDVTTTTMLSTTNGGGGSGRASVMATTTGGGMSINNILEAIRSQYIDEVDEFITALRHHLQVVHDNTADPFGKVRAADVESALRAVDSHKSDQEVHEYLRRGARDRYLTDDSRISTLTFVHQLISSGPVHASGHWLRFRVNAPLEPTN